MANLCLLEGFGMVVVVSKPTTRRKPQNSSVLVGESPGDLDPSQAYSDLNEVRFIHVSFYMRLCV